MIGVFDFLCDLFLLHSPKRGGRGGRGSRVVILGSCFQILMKQPSAAVCGVESCLRQTKRTKNRARPSSGGRRARDVSIGAMLTTKKAVSRLQEKGRYRKKGGANGILGMYPAGTGELGVIKSRDEFLEGREGDELWYKHVEENTSGFSNSYLYHPF